MTLLDLLALFAVAGGAVFLWDSLRAREAANAAIRAACKREGLLFLDDTVALDSLRPVRNAAGRLVLRRVYGFDYSDTGVHRRHGTVSLLGRVVLAVDVELPPPSPDVPLH